MFSAERHPCVAPTVLGHPDFYEGVCVRNDDHFRNETSSKTPLKPVKIWRGVLLFAAHVVCCRCSIAAFASRSKLPRRHTKCSSQARSELHIAKCRNGVIHASLTSVYKYKPEILGKCTDHLLRAYLIHGNIHSYTCQP